MSPFLISFLYKDLVEIDKLTSSLGTPKRLLYFPGKPINLNRHKELVKASTNCHLPAGRAVALPLIWLMLCPSLASWLRFTASLQGWINLIESLWFHLSQLILWKGRREKLHSDITWEWSSFTGRPVPLLDISYYRTLRQTKLMGFITRSLELNIRMKTDNWIIFHPVCVDQRLKSGSLIKTKINI